MFSRACHFVSLVYSALQLFCDVQSFISGSLVKIGIISEVTVKAYLIKIPQSSTFLWNGRKWDIDTGQCHPSEGLLVKLSLGSFLLL